MITEHILTMIDREIESIEHIIMSGACSDFTMYREHIGILTGLKAARDITKKADASLDEDVD